MSACGRITSLPLGKGLIEARSLGQGRISARPLGVGSIAMRCAPPSEEDELRINTTADLYLDPQNSTGNASDSGPATATQPMLTSREFSRRFGTAIDLQETRLHVLSAGNAGDPLVLVRHYGGPVSFNQFTLIGPTPTTLYSGTLTGVTAENSATGQKQLIEINNPGFDWDTAGPGGTSLIGHRVRMVDGASPGSVCWLVERISATQAWVNRPINAETYANPTLAIGSQIVVESLPQMPPVIRWHHYSLYGQGGGWAHVRDCKFGEAQFESLDVRNIWFHACDLSDVFSVTNLDQTNLWFTGCRVGGGINGPILLHGFLALEGCLSQVGYIAAGKVFFTENGLHVGGGRLLVTSRSLVKFQGGTTGFFNWSSGPAVDVDGECVATIAGRVWGNSANANTWGWTVRHGGSASQTVMPTVRGTLTDTGNGGSNTRDILLGSQDYFYSDVPQLYSGGNTAQFV